MKKLLLLSFTLLSILCFSQNKNKFSLQGKTKEIADGTVLKLKNSLTDKFIDSVIVKNNTFLIQTILPSSPLRVVLFKDGSTAKTIWVENNPMTFNSVHTSFNEAIITGSETDILYTKLCEESKPLTTYEEIVEVEMKFIQNHPNSILSASNLLIMAPGFGKKKSAELFSKMSQENKESEYGKKISSLLLDLNDEKAPQIGEKYVDFSMKDQNGIEKQLSSLNGKIILLEFWASWCGPCRQENPNLINTYNQFKSNGFEIFSVSLDDKKENWIKAIQKDGLNWQHVSDLKGQTNKAALIYKVNGIPDNILIDRNGIIIGRNLRGENLNQKIAEQISLPAISITSEKMGTKIKISGAIIWKDENGKELTETEFKKLLATQKYIPNLDTEKNIMTLQKI